MKNLLQGLKPYEISEYVLLLLMAAAIPISWSLAVKILALLLANMIIKSAASHKIGSKSLTPIGRYSMWISIAFLAVYIVSLLYTENMSDGLDNVSRKLPFLLFPLFFLLSDISYMRKEHVRALLYIFVAILCVRFMWKFGYAVYRFFIIKEVDHFPHSDGFDSLHHTYLAMYVLFALGFIYTEIVRYWKILPFPQQLICAISIPLLLAYLVCIQSRTGYVGLALMVAFVFIHVIFVQKRYLFGIIALILVTIGTVGVYTALPDTSHRLTNTVRSVLSGSRTDDRFVITSTAISTISDNMPWGVGAGDRSDQLLQHYQSTTRDETVLEHIYNPHNQFLDSLLSTGVVGLLLLLSLFVVPLVRLRQNPQRELLLALLACTILTALFESIFERQMGMMFFLFFYGMTQQLLQTSDL